jgi:hypothetical protein
MKMHRAKQHNLTKYSTYDKLTDQFREDNICELERNNFTTDWLISRNKSTTRTEMRNYKHCSRNVKKLRVRVYISF